MAYATPAQYAQAFGLSEALQMLQDEEHTLTPEALQAGLVAIAAGAVVADAVAAVARACRQWSESTAHAQSVAPSWS